jgi:hypothetical protein
MMIVKKMTVKRNEWQKNSGHRGLSLANDRARGYSSPPKSSDTGVVILIELNGFSFVATRIAPPVTVSTP